MSFLTQKDVDKIQSFYYALQDDCSKRNVALRQLGEREYADERTSELFCVGWFFQVQTAKYELFVNLNVEDVNFRYGWNFVGGML